MGYRSEVAIKCESTAYRRLMKVIEEVGFLPDHIYKYEDENLTFENIEYILHWDYVKWYGESVDKIERELNKLKVDYNRNEDNKCGFFLTRIGEEDGDIEYDYNTPGLYINVITKLDLVYNGVIK